MNRLTTGLEIRLLNVVQPLMLLFLLMTSVLVSARPIDIKVEPDIPNAPSPQPDDPPAPALPPLSSAKSAIVIDLNTGEVLGEKSADTMLPMASTTKIMTALLVMEEIDRGGLSLNTIVTVSDLAGTMGDMFQKQRSAGSIMGDITGTGQDQSVGLTPGDTVSIQDLLYGLLLDSGNDAAIALAEAVAGTAQYSSDLQL